MEKVLEIQNPQLNMLKELECKPLNIKKSKRNQAKSEKEKEDISHYSSKRISKGEALHISYVIAQILGTAAL